MGIVFRQSVKTSIVVFTGALLGALSIWLSTKYIPQRQYGFINNLTRWAMMLSVFTPFGLNNTLAVFIHRYNNEDNKRKMLLTICLVVPLVITLFVSAIYFLIPEWILHHFQPEDRPLMRMYYVWLPVYTVLFVYMTMLEQYLCSQMKVAISSFMREVLLRVINIVLILLFAFQYVTFSTLVMGTVFIYFVPVLIFVLISYNTKGFGLSFNLNSFTGAEYKEILHFSWYHYLYNISMMLLAFMDALLIPLYDVKGFSTLAVYAVAIFFISLINMPSKAFMQASLSALANAFAEKDIEKAKDIFVRSSINLLIPTLGVVVIMCCNLENAVAIIGNGRNYSGLIPVFLVLLIGQLINIGTGMNDQVLSITNYYKFNFYVSLGISAILYFLIRYLVPRYGIYGAAWASTLALAIYNLLKFYFVWKKLDMQPFSSKTLLAIMAALPALAAGLLFPYFFNPDRHVYIHTFIDAIMRSSIIVVVYVLMLLWLKPSKDLQEYIASVRKDKRLF
jgi:O-antigen/teichoic acid export membrane protein